MTQQFGMCMLWSMTVLFSCELVWASYQLWWMKANVRNVRSSFVVIFKHKMQGTLLCHINVVEYTGCHRRNGPNFGRVFLTLKYMDITQNTYIQSWTVTEIMAREVWNFDSLLIAKFCMYYFGKRVSIFLMVRFWRANCAWILSL